MVKTYRFGELQRYVERVPFNCNILNSKTIRYKINRLALRINNEIIPIIDHKPRLLKQYKSTKSQKDYQIHQYFSNYVTLCIRTSKHDYEETEKVLEISRDFMNLFMPY